MAHRTALAVLTFLSAALPAQSSDRSSADAGNEHLTERVAVSRNTGLVADGVASWVGVGPDYSARFDENGMRFRPALGATAPYAVAAAAASPRSKALVASSSCNRTSRM